ncbi:NmrA family NAD(P)-binding protein [Radicibacter daui]|uniref:NmrA family NAD(P)-binding protein n=1 Tax=Radicibacter daui TaxID=3064829 RepID=UPI004046EAE0
MYAITGVTGKVGGEVARTLLAAGKPVRAILRDETKGPAWAALGCETTLASMEDKTSLIRAFTGAEAVFVMVPPLFDPEPGFPEARRLAAALSEALAAARPHKVVYLSTIGADAGEENLLSQHTLLEAALAKTGIPTTFLRPGWFMENAAWDVAPARETGILHSFLTPLDKAFPMVATRDVGRVAAALLQQGWQGNRVVELEGPQRVSPNDMAVTLAGALGRPVRAEALPHNQWEPLFRSQGARHPIPRIRMLDGFNEGWIEFRERGRYATKGTTSLDTAISSLVAASQGA